MVKKDHCWGGGAAIFGKERHVGYALKADVRHYFDTIDQKTLLNILKARIKDADVIWLIKLVLGNYRSETQGKGMPLGNLTSQFFANVYLNELDRFVKHELRAKYYIRYVDDFIIFHKDKALLEAWKAQIDYFLNGSLKIGLHPEKSGIVPLKRGITFLGFRLFHKYRLLKKSNTRRIWKRLEIFGQRYEEGRISKCDVVRSMEGWIAYAEFANTYNLRKRVFNKANEMFSLSGVYLSPTLLFHPCLNSRED